MKLFLAKLGKSWNMIRKNGILGGGKIVWEYFWKYLKAMRTGSGDILYITAGVGDSARFRTYNQAEELRFHGFKTSVTNQDNPFLVRAAGKFKIFIFHRTFVTKNISKFISEIKKHGGMIMFETDDLVHDPEFLKHMDYYKKMTGPEKKIYENGIGSEIVNDPEVKYAVTTTTYLADKLREKGKEVLISKNKLPQEDLNWCQNFLATPKEEKAPGEVRVGYFSGTMSHNKDFASITPALMELLRKYPQMALYVAGPLDLESELLTFGDRVRSLPFVPREQYFGNIYKVDINLAPLELGNPFCEAKSEIKFSEPGILGIPTVAVKNQTFSETIIDGVDGFLAATTEEWVEKVGRLIEDENLRKTMGEKARQKVLADYSTKNSHNEEYYDFLREKIKNLS